jgi:cell wall-associated NlpC family hydrolase
MKVSGGFERSNQVSAAESNSRTVRPWRGGVGSIGRAIAACIALSVLLAATPAKAQQSVDHPDAVVARPVVNMYRNATAASDVVSQALYGTGVQTLQSSQDWFSIRTADGYTGWVEAADLKALNGSTYAPKGDAVRVTAISANVYREPDVTAHAPVLQLPWESRLEPAPPPAKNTERWLEVRLVDGQMGWVQRGDISDNFTPVNMDDMLQLAHRFIGTTYTWGGVSSLGFDCSGFTQMLERQRGIEMPRDADIQASWSRVIAVERKDLQPGDLLYFGSSPSRITHTGMYLGNGDFIHDTTHDHPGVQISRLDDMPWTKLLVAIRRVKP